MEQTKTKRKSNNKTLPIKVTTKAIWYKLKNN